MGRWFANCVGLTQITQKEHWKYLGTKTTGFDSISLTAWSHFLPATASMAFHFGGNIFWVALYLSHMELFSWAYHFYFLTKSDVAGLVAPLISPYFFTAGSNLTVQKSVLSHSCINNNSKFWDCFCFTRYRHTPCGKAPIFSAKKREGTCSSLWET